MKKLLISLIAVLVSVCSYAQYFKREFHQPPSGPTVRFESTYDGLRTRLNFTSNNPLNYSFTGVGTTNFLTPQPCPYPDSILQHFRFIRINKKGNIINANVALLFADNNTTSYRNSEGFGVCEINNAAHNGGYIGVGDVYNNGCNVPLNYDGLFVKLNGSGNAIKAYRFDFSSGKDVFRKVINSKLNPDTYYICGYSEFTNHSNVLLLSVNSLGTVNWVKSIQFATLPQQNVAFCHAYDLAEDTVTGDIVVVGTITDPNLNPAENALAFKTTSAGNILWSEAFGLAGTVTTSAFYSVIQTHDHKFMIGGTNHLNPLPPPAPPVFFDMWLTKIDPTGAVLFSSKLRENTGTVTSTIESKCYDLTERLNTAGAYEYYLDGPGYASSPKVSMYKTDANGNGIANYLYASDAYDDAFAIDNIQNNDNKPGIIMFSGTKDPPANVGQPFSYWLKTYYNGATCPNACPNNPPITYNFQPSTLPLEFISNTERTRTLLTSASVTVLTSQICSQNTLACGSNAKAQEENEPDALNVYPNPAGDYISVSLKNTDQPFELKVFNAIDQEVIVKKYSASDNEIITIDISALPSGLYFLRAQTENGIEVREFVKN